MAHLNNKVFLFVFLLFSASCFAVEKVGESPSAQERQGQKKGQVSKALHKIRLAEGSTYSAQEEQQGQKQAPPQRQAEPEPSHPDKKPKTLDPASRFSKKKRWTDVFWQRLQRDSLTQSIKNPTKKPKKPTKTTEQKATADKKATKSKTPSKALSQSQPLPLHQSPCTIELKITGVIGAATLDIINRAFHEVEARNCSALLLLINTPGGMLLSTRKIVDRILNADFPVLCLMYPSGAHAGSAGAIIMQACHVNGGIETTNIGAATPILGRGGNLSKDLRNKMINDTTAWLDSLTKLRNRSREFGRKIVTEAKALDAKAAKEAGGIDFVSQTKQDFLRFAEGRKTLVKDGKTRIVQTGDIVALRLGFRYKLISLLTEPEIIYILFTGSLLLLYWEITHPGLGAPGILGAIGLVISFMGMHKLDFSWAGLILLILSMVLFLAEVFISGFGIFGAGAIVSFILGSFLLFDPAKTGGLDIPVSLILSVSFVFSLLMGAIAYLAYSTFKMRKKSSISDDFMDQNNLPAEVVQVSEGGLSGIAFINGENWRFRSKNKVQKGDKVKILSHEHLILEVELVSPKASKSSKGD